jgi:hypothetical protein
VCQVAGDDAHCRVAVMCVYVADTCDQPFARIEFVHPLPVRGNVGIGDLYDFHVVYFLL